jgi:DNA-binding response OmpR family regulator
MTSYKSVLVIEDDATVAYMIREALVENSFDVLIASSGHTAVPFLLQQGQCDLAIIDIGAPNMKGLDFLKSLGKERAYGVIVVAASSEAADIVAALETGADDYIAKPFEPQELLARVRSVIRRYTTQRRRSLESPSFVDFEDWTYDKSMRQVKKTGELPEKLTASESRLLDIFIGNPRKILTRNRILDLLYSADSDIPFDRSIDVAITRLRRKIERNARRPRYIKTAHGDGYIFDPKGE